MGLSHNKNYQATAGDIELIKFGLAMKRGQTKRDFWM